MGGAAGSSSCPPPSGDVVPEEEEDGDLKSTTTTTTTTTSPIMMISAGDHAPSSSSSSSSSSFSHTPITLAHAPILLLVYFHKAFRAEFADLRRAVSDVTLARGFHSQHDDFVNGLIRRFQFLKLACKYHCAAEDEVIFMALDVHVKNVAHTYSLEHKSIDGLFDSIFLRLNSILMEQSTTTSSIDRNVSMKPFQELVFCIGTIQTFISKHMLKEEEQIFPLLMEHISVKEQASLVWQFMCSVPIVLMEDLLSWMLSFLSPEEQQEVTTCIKEIVPEEKSLQEVVLSWLGSKNQSGGPQFPNGDSLDLKILLKSYSSMSFLGENWTTQIHNAENNIGHNPIDDLHLWHGAIKKDLIAVLKELYQSRSSSNFSSLDKIVVRLKFLADIITFYSNALEKLFCPVLNELVHGCKSPSIKGFPSETHIEGLQMLLYYNSQNDTNLSKFVDKLCQELESFVFEISKQFDFHEAEVFPMISRKCSHEIQQQLLYVSIHMMPLGLLKCVITWFSAHLSEDQSRSILNRINNKEGDSNLITNGAFTSLLRDWLRFGCSGKISVEKFGRSLQRMFKSRCSFIPEQIKDKDAAGSSILSLLSNSTNQPIEHDRDHSRLNLLSSAKKGKSHLSFSHSSGESQTIKKYETSYSSVINLHIYFPETVQSSTYHPFLENGAKHSGCSSVVNDPKPVDIIFYIHKALKKDLEYLVFGSTQLVENPALVTDFRRRFELIEYLYRIHSEAEDEVAFPALEAMGKFTNISHSYTMDHKLEVEHFKRVSLIVGHLSELSASDQAMGKHYRLCLTLHDMCESLLRSLSDHIHREEVELWPMFRECFSLKEQERIIGCILGRTKAEILQDMIPWLMGSLTQEEQHTLMSLWRQITRNTMFDEWLREWWEGYDLSKTAAHEDSNYDETPSNTIVSDPLEIISTYLGCEASNYEKEGDPFGKNMKVSEKECGLLGGTTEVKQMGECNVDDKALDYDFNLYDYNSLEHRGITYGEDEKKIISIHEMENVTCTQIKPGPFFQAAQKSKHYDLLLKMSQEDLEAAIRRVSRDSSLDSQKKSYIIQNLLVSRWIIRQNPHLSVTSHDEQEFPGQHPSYKDPLKQSFGCKHYKRNCKLVAPCCNHLFTCLRCHDEVIADHVIDRKSVTEMMCMRCLKIQLIGPTCSTLSCSKFSMAKYFCRICKIFDDEREIYHCPYCNLCRLGKGLGIDYFHCMNCNACMARTLMVHICREKCFMDNCPICHEDIFTSSLPVKALQCGHLMHSQCFEAYTCTSYTCPICGKSLGDMQVYFKMLDALLAEEKIPDEYSAQIQVILCNDCEKRGEAPFHWLYHKCSFCGSYNTRLL